MASSSNANPAVPANSDQYNLAKTQAFSLEIEELMKLRDDVQGEINRRASEVAQRQREEEERKRREDEETGSLFAAWVPKHFAKYDRKEEERALKRQKGPRYGSATESNSEAGSDAGFEYPVEEVNTSEEDSDDAEENWKMQRASPAEEFSKSDEELPDVSNDEDDEEGSDEESSLSGDGDTSHASSGSSCSERYEEDEDWSYDEEDF
ncbi:vicilin-like seed storage protein At2g18540 [Papaver somniferum]|uniref:vicilin-like seed storage protein At2g18540 n=1 Tax=Papaver somniferum TaxID=3469 RepID=UPI000E704EA3|nr:vicilin-like seed storage protein At2g18540 [Papaver somniferum]